MDHHQWHFQSGQLPTGLVHHRSWKNQDFAEFAVHQHNPKGYFLMPADLLHVPCPLQSVLQGVQYPKQMTELPKLPPKDPDPLQKVPHGHDENLSALCQSKETKANYESFCFPWRFLQN